MEICDIISNYVTRSNIAYHCNIIFSISPTAGLSDREEEVSYSRRPLSPKWSIPTPTNLCEIQSYLIPSDHWSTYLSTVYSDWLSKVSV